jgi:hypothetical protein
MTQQEINTKLNDYIIKMERKASEQTELHRYLDCKNKARAAKRALIKLNKRDIQEELRTELELIRQDRKDSKKLNKLID